MYYACSNQYIKYIKFVKLVRGSARKIRHYQDSAFQARRAHIQEIVGASMWTEQEREWMEEYAPQVTTDITYNDKENRYEERITMPNLFDMRAKNYHKESNLI